MKAIFHPNVIFLTENPKASFVKNTQEHVSCTVINSFAQLSESKFQVLMFDMIGNLEDTMEAINHINMTQSNLELIFVSENGDIKEVTSLLNKCNIGGVITTQNSPDEMKNIVNSAIDRCKEKDKQERYLLGIERTNEQLEFHLRERLIS